MNVFHALVSRQSFIPLRQQGPRAGNRLLWQEVKRPIRSPFACQNDAVGSCAECPIIRKKRRTPADDALPPHRHLACGPCWRSGLSRVGQFSLHSLADQLSTTAVEVTPPQGDQSDHPGAEGVA